MIKAIIFDIDGVLIDSFEANLRFYQGLMAAMGHRSPTREEFPVLFHLPLREVIRKLTGLRSEEEVERIFKLGKSRESGYPVELLRMPNGAEETIRTLSKSYALGIVTSRIRDSVYESPQLAALKQYFHVAVSYEDTENHKPHPDPLLLAAQKLGVKPSECVYIGDVENDIKAARGADMKCILYSKDKIEGADAETFDFAAIPALIEGL